MFDFLNGPVRDLVTQIYDAVGYLGVALWVAIESVIIPIPSELVLPFAGFLVGEGTSIEPLTGSPWSYWLTVLAGTVGATVGALVAYAIGWIETRVGKEIGTDKDRPGMDFNASGDPTQQDCVDEATNTTTYLTVLDQNGLLKYHTITRPMSKENLLRGVAGWPHWTAVLVEKGNGQRWAVDSWIYANGENPAIVEAEKWYIDTLDNLPIAMR